ncbi:MAG TPA: hypothetical protein VIU65_11665, partial [Pyrinomonadaceae bacterium]
MSLPYLARNSGIVRYARGENIWLRAGDSDAQRELSGLSPHVLSYEVFDSEAAVGRVMFEEIETVAHARPGDITIIILGGRGAQALHRLLGEKARTGELDDLLARLRVFTQDALAPMRMNNSFSFVR